MWVKKALGSLGRRQAAPKWFVWLLYTAIASMDSLLSIWENADKVTDNLVSTWSSHSRTGETYDFIIIGAGSAGSVVANRLSENPNWKILLIEAGGEPNPMQSIPIGAVILFNYPQTDWMHRTTPQKNACLGLVNRQSGWAQGKSLGGSSNINFLLHFRGNHFDFDNWARITGDSSWNYENVLKYFIKYEDYEGEWATDGFHGTGGPLHVQVPAVNRLGREYVEAATEMGYSKVDQNSNYTEGFDSCYHSIKNGQRHATYKSYIQPSRKRPNLTIFKYAHVNKILFKDGTRQAYGVQYDRHGQKRYAYASKEIILSGGAVQSPKLLMLSGVGPNEHLTNLKIPVIADRPGVGQNLQDHITTLLGPFEMKSSNVDTISLDHDITPRSFIEYMTSGAGPLGSSFAQASGILSSSYAKDWPDLQLLLLGVSVHKGFGQQLSRVLNLKSRQFIKYYENSIGKNSFHQIVSLGRPKSRGEIRLASPNPYVEPIIDPKYFDDEDDIKILLEGVKKAVHLVENTPTFKRLGTSLTSTILPGCEHVPHKSDLYYECYIRTYSITLFHTVGTCAMGRNDSVSSVVDSELKVIGVSGLRVIDASIMPVVPVSNTQAPTIMIGEKGSDLIKRTWMT